MATAANHSRTSTTTLTAAFDDGSGKYDLLVALNPGYHRHLRAAARRLIRSLGHSRSPALLDLACGTGASTRALVRAGVPGTRVLGIDFSPGMLQRAMGKRWPKSVDFTVGDAAQLDVAHLGPGAWDGAFASYLFRNVAPADRDAALRAVFTLLQPGGWLVTQEFSLDDRRRSSLVWDLVCRLVIIPLATVLDGEPSLYRYLQRSVHAFDSRTEFLRRLHQAGFVDLRSSTVRGWQRGILHTFIARKPEQQ